MYNKPIIAFFDSSLRVIGFVVVDDEVKFEETIFCFKNQKNKIDEFVSSLNLRNPRLKKEVIGSDSISVGLEETTNKSEMITAVSEEFKMAGFFVKIVPDILKEILIFISSKYTLEQREKVLGDLTNLPLDTDEEALKELHDILLEVEVEKIANSLV